MKSTDSERKQDMIKDASMTIHRLKLAGVFVDFTPRFPDTLLYLRKYLADEGPFRDENGPEAAAVTAREYETWAKAGNTIDGFAEFCLLCQPCSEALFYHDRCIFHAAAVRYRGRAFLIAGGSGAGKSTHCSQLLRDHPDEFSVINGDKPILQCTEEDVIVHPSPWNGKEGQKGAKAAKLAGIFLIRRTDKNQVTACNDREAAVFMFPLIFQSYMDEDGIKKAGSITEKIVRSAPCYIFSSKDIEESSALLYQTIKGVFHGKEAPEDGL